MQDAGDSLAIVESREIGRGAERKQCHLDIRLRQSRNELRDAKSCRRCLDGKGGQGHSLELGRAPCAILPPQLTDAHNRIPRAGVFSAPKIGGSMG